MNILFPILLYVLPFILAPILGRGITNFKRFAVISFLFGSLLGEFAFLVLSGRSSVLSDDFWWTLVALYPMAAIPLGFWIVTLASVGYRLARYIRVRYSASLPLLYCLGLVLGASVGAIFMKLYVDLATSLSEGHDPKDGLFLPYIAAGLVCGAGIGLVCVKFSENSESK